jgi:RNA polymerase sigma factor (sigma-70 family)
MPVFRLTERQWLRYQQGIAGEVARRLAARRESLIVEHLPMAERIARHVARSFAPHLQIDDLIQDARVGLVQAADRYRSEDGPFPRFAFLRVRGAVVDAQKRRTYREEMHYSIDEWLAADASGLDGADGKLPIPLWLVQERIHRYLSDRGPLPDELAAEAERYRRLRQAIATLPEEQRMVVERALAGEVAAQIAETEGRSPNWARVRLNAARQALAAQLKEAA